MLPFNVKTLANYVEGAGYETAYVGKWHLASEGELEQKPVIDHATSAVPPMYRGGYTGYWRVSDVLEFTSDGYGGYIFDEDMNKLEFKGYRCDCITDYAIDFIKQYDGKKPFFMTVSHIEPHHQNNAKHYQGPLGSKEEFKNFIPPKDLELHPEGDWKEEYPDYLGAIHSVDRNLGRLIEALKEKGVYENTVIIYASDHGSHFRTLNRDGNLNGYDDYKRAPQDGATHVPLVIWGGPFTQGGKHIKEIVSTASIPKTITMLTGTDVTDYMIGENLADFAVGNIPEGRKNEAFIQISESRIGRALRTEDYLYSVFAPGINGGERSSSSCYVDDFLYDIKKDPYQQNNVIDDEAYREIKLEMRKKLLWWIQEAEHAEPEIRDRK